MKLLVYVVSNWKKVAVCLGGLSYVTNYSYNSYKVNKSIRESCKQATFYGNEPGQPKKILLILNPAAKDRKAEKYYKDFCEPILHLAGFMIDVLRTESEGHAKTFIESLENLPDGIVIAGGDGMISEAVTGLMRRKNGKCPVAILPIGNENKIAWKHYSIKPENYVEYVNTLANATLAIVRGKVQEKDVIQLVAIGDENTQTQKPIYSLGSFEWGAFRDAISLKEKYWYFGFLKKYASVVLNAYNKNLSWACKADVSYSPSCPGCKNCVESQEISNKHGTFWLLPFLTSSKSDKRNTLENKNCSEQTFTKIEASGVHISTEREDNVSKLMLCLDPDLKLGWTFLTEGLKKVWKNNEKFRTCIESRSIMLVPKATPDHPENVCSIDGEEFDVKSLNIRVMPKAIKVFANIN